MNHLKRGGGSVCYCSNVLPLDAGGSVSERFAETARLFREVRELLGVSEGTPFPLGLWIDAGTAEKLSTDSAELDALRGLLEEDGFVVATMNAFPYGRFHGTAVKTDVYRPDWTTPERLEHTIRCAEIASRLPRPEGVVFPISTLPGGYRSAFGSGLAEAELEIASNILKASEKLEDISSSTGADIVLSVEMEPDCLWETPAEFADFHERFISTRSTGNRVGVCYDTCHQELVEGAPGSGLKLLGSRGIRVSKLQVSAALSATFGRGFDISAAHSALAGFAENVYLHQTRVFRADGTLAASFPDIPRESDFLVAASTAGAGGGVVSHFHAPLYLDILASGLRTAKVEAEHALRAVSSGILPEPCVEVETYTYSVLPEGVAVDSLAVSIARELEWTKERLR
jgi:sugar phosphate isomerase/epimerase